MPGGFPVNARLSPLILAITLLLSLALAGPVAAKGNNGEAQVNAALMAMSAGPNTIAGPGHYEAGGDGNRVIYEVISGPAPDVCITLRNRGSNGRVKIVVPGEPEEESLRPGLTVSRCYATPSEISLKCGGNNSSTCRAVWRIDAL